MVDSTVSKYNQSWYPFFPLDDHESHMNGVMVHPQVNLFLLSIALMMSLMPDAFWYFILGIALEIFEKAKKRRPVFPLENKGDFIVLYNGEGKS